MMDLTDRHFRYLVRRVTRRTLLYSEMLTAAAVLRGDRDRLLGFDPEESPVVLQLGGDDPVALAEAAGIGAEYGYAEVNLNVGCPSPRVSSGNFGACLMKEPERVGAAVMAMRAAVGVPVTVKHRTGVDDRDSFEELLAFVDEAAGAGADAFVVHARKAWLKGLSPKANRSVPPLDYGAVYRLKRERPELVIELNGGVPDLEAAAEHLRHVDGVMLGRAVYEDPFVLAGADDLLSRFDPGPQGGDAPGAPGVGPGPRAVVEGMYPYVEAQLAQGVPLHAITRHMLGLFRGRPGARAWRRMLSEGSHEPGAGVRVLAAALAALPADVADGGLSRVAAGTRAR